MKWIKYHGVLITSSMPNVSSPFTIRKLNKIWLIESLHGASDHTAVISDHTQDGSLFRVHLCMVRYFMYGLFLTSNDSLALNLTIWSRGTIRHNSRKNTWISQPHGYHYELNCVQSKTSLSKLCQSFRKYFPHLVGFTMDFIKSCVGRPIWWMIVKKREK